MKYIFVPDSYDYNIIKNNFSEEEFLELQNKYRNSIEEMLSKIIDFKQLDEKITKVLKVPVVEDKDYNFYHKFSNLGSNYIYLRNNIHIERLSKEDVERLKSNNIDEDYIKRTLPNVMYEEGEATFFGNPIMEKLVNSKSLVFEFAYDQTKLETVQEINIVERMGNELKKYLETIIRNSLNLPTSFIQYKRIPDYFMDNKNNQVEEDIKNIMN